MVMILFCPKSERYGNPFVNGNMSRSVYSHQSLQNIHCIYDKTSFMAFSL